MPVCLDIQYLFLNHHKNCMRADNWSALFTVMKGKLGDGSRPVEMWTWEGNQVQNISKVVIRTGERGKTMKSQFSERSIYCGSHSNSLKIHLFHGKYNEDLNSPLMINCIKVLKVTILNINFNLRCSR